MSKPQYQQTLQDQLFHAEQKFNLISEGIKGVVYDWNLSTNEVERTSGLYSLLGFDPDEVPPTSEWWRSRIHPQDYRELKHVIEGYKGERYEIEYRVMHRDGHYIHIQDRGIIVRDVSNTPVRIVGTNFDISERKLLEEQKALLLEEEKKGRKQAEESNRAKDEFLAMISHELRTPLQAILGWVQLLRRGRLDPQTSSRALELIERNTKAQAKLISDLLDISRIISGKFGVTTQQVDLRDIIEGSIELIRPEASAKGIEIIYHPCHSTPIIGDFERLQQVFCNILTNAVKFSPKDRGQITIKVEIDKDSLQAKVTISDNGAGIDPQFLPYIFEKFRQEDLSATRSYRGLGIGLAIVKHLLEMHKGEIHAESRGLGKGSKFSVSLPLLAKEMGDSPGLSSNVNPKEAVKSTGLFSRQLDGVSVLVLEDEDDSRSFLSAVLSGAGAQVRTASRVVEALRQLQDELPHAIVSDIGLPDHDGFSFIRKIRKLSPAVGGNIAVIALTAYASESDKKRILESGFNGFLSKPVDASELIQAVLDHHRTACR